MERSEVRYYVTRALLQADGPLTLAELASESRVSASDLSPVLREMIRGKLVVEGELLPERPAPQYCWADRWETTVQQRDSSARRDLRTAVEPADRVPNFRLDVDSEASVAFHDHVIHEYRPPLDKRFLVVLQCSVRRPFSKSPSHASMRKAIRVATGYDPRKDFESCPVHVVVLASKIGPVPYELEDVYPANVRGGGVKRYSPEHFGRVKPVLAQRMAQYVLTHGDRYEQVATFTHGRYAEVMEAAREIVGEKRGKHARFSVLPDMGGVRIVWVGESKPHAYWARYWIQLYLTIVSWLKPEERALAQERLVQMQVEYKDNVTLER